MEFFVWAKSFRVDRRVLLRSFLFHFFALSNPFFLQDQRLFCLRNRVFCASQREHSVYVSPYLKSLTMSAGESLFVNGLG